jgi:type III secretion protein R
MNVNLSNPLEIILLLLTTSMVPFLAATVTSFAKIVIIFGIIRNALGLQQTPPNIVLTSLAIIITCYIMAPVASDTFAVAQSQKLSGITLDNAPEKLGEISKPITLFLVKNSTIQTRLFFLEKARQLWPKRFAEKATENDFLIAMPAFVLTEITQAFKIGFIIYLPFVVVDLIVSNVLMALGIVMISPTTVSLPFKLMLFVLLDGWMRLIDGLMLTYRIG